MTITGEFDVKLSPLESSAAPTGATKVGRMAIDKKFHGDLTATSKGEMLTALTGTSGSAGYVAIEQVSGTLLGKTGTFVLQHFGMMSAGTQRLTLEVVPASGEGELVGLSGKMEIKIESGKHFYIFDFTFQK